MKLKNQTKTFSRPRSALRVRALRVPRNHPAGDTKIEINPNPAAVSALLTKDEDKDNSHSPVAGSLPVRRTRVRPTPQTPESIIYNGRSGVFRSQDPIKFGKMAVPVPHVNENWNFLKGSNRLSAEGAVYARAKDTIGKPVFRQQKRHKAAVDFIVRGKQQTSPEEQERQRQEQRDKNDLSLRRKVLSEHAKAAQRSRDVIGWKNCGPRTPERMRKTWLPGTSRALEIEGEIAMRGTPGRFFGRPITSRKRRALLALEGRPEGSARMVVDIGTGRKTGRMASFGVADAFTHSIYGEGGGGGASRTSPACSSPIPWKAPAWWS